MAQQTWEAFETEYKLIRKFGVKAVQNKLNAELKRQGQTVKLSPDNVLSILNQAVQTNEINAYMDKAFKLDLDRAKQLLMQHQSPRADNRPELTNENLVPQDPNARQTQGYKNPPWAFKMDAGDPKVRDAIQQIVNNPRDAKAITRAFDNVVKDALRNSHDLRLRMAARPTYKPKMKPRPGEY